MNDTLRFVIYVICAAHVALFVAYVVISLLIAGWLRTGANGEFRGLLILAIVNAMRSLWLIGLVATVLILDPSIGAGIAFIGLIGFGAAVAILHISALVNLAYLATKQVSDD